MAFLLLSLGLLRINLFPPASSSRHHTSRFHNSHRQTPEMELFGVQELPNSKSISAPGWAYVPDTIGNSTSASQSTSRKRTVRNQPKSTSHDHNAKQDAKVLRDLAALDKESYRDVQIPVPVRHRDNAGRGEPLDQLRSRLNLPTTCLQ